MKTTLTPPAPLPCIVIMEDWHSERPVAFRAFTATHPDADTVCTLVGYCAPGGSFRTIGEAARDARKRDKESPIFRAFHSGKPSRRISV